LFLERPACGWGLDTFQLVFGTKRTADFGRVEWDATPTRAHNEVLHLLATQGLAGLAAAALFGAGLVRAAAGAWRRAAAADRPLVVAAGAGLVAFAVQDLFGFTVVGCGTLAATCAALLSRWGVGETAASRRAGGVSPLMNGSTTPREYQGANAPRSPWSFTIGLAAAGALAVAVFAANVGAAGAGACAVLAAVAALCVFALWRVEAAETGVDVAVRSFAPAPWRRLAQAGVGVAAVGLLCTLVVRPFEAALACRDGDLRADADPDDALACYARAVAADPDDARAWLKLSGAAQLAARRAPTAAAKRDRFARALAALDRAAALAPADPCVPATRGRLLGEMACDGLARPGDSAAAWDAALAADPANAAFLAEAARSALAVGDHDRMRRLVERGQSLYPHYALWHAHLGAGAYAEGRLPEAAEALETALRADWHGDADGTAHAFALLSAVRLRLGQHEPAIGLADNAHALAPEWPTPWLLRARALAALGRRVEASAAYRQFLVLVPDDADARAALRRLDAPASRPGTDGR
jgi:tetratricopeptide (TPR) repeat protein